MKKTEILETVVLTEAQCAHYIGCSRSALRKGRMNGYRDKSPTPPFIKRGKSVRYLREDLDKFLAQHRIGDERSQG